MSEKNTLRSLLDAVSAGSMSVEEALAHCGDAVDADGLSYANLDHLRAQRTGFPEVVYCPGKSDEQIAAIVERLASHAGVVVATRATQSNFEAVRRIAADATFDADARIIAVERISGVPREELRPDLYRPISKRKAAPRRSNKT